MVAFHLLIGGLGMLTGFALCIRSLQLLIRCYSRRGNPQYRLLTTGLVIFSFYMGLLTLATAMDSFP